MGINLFFIILALLLKSQSDLVLLPIVAVVCLIISFVLKRKQQSILNSFTNA